MFTATLEGEAELIRMQRHFAQDLWRGARAAVEDACAAGVDVARRGAFADDTGRLRRNLRHVLLRATDQEVVGEMQSPEEYSSFVEEGTGPHDIWPKSGEGSMGPLRRGQSRRDAGDIGTHRVALRWYDAGGAVRFARMVHHPGSRSFPFMGPAYLRAEAVLTARMEAEIAKAAARLSS